MASRRSTTGSCLARLLEARLVGHRLCERHRVGRVGRHQLAQPVDLPVGHFQHAPDVAQRGARLQRAEGDDLRDAPGAVAALHVADHLVAPVLAEIDVEVRHRHAVGIEEALEEQAEAQRVEVGDGQRPGDHRAGARAAPRPDRDPLPLRPLDEIRDDQEVARVLHLLDDAELEGEPLAVIRLARPGRRAMRGEPAREPRFRLAAQLVGLLALGRLRVGGGDEARQDRLHHARPGAAAPRDFHRVLQRLRQVGEAAHHLLAAGEMMLRRQPPPVVGGDEPPLRDGEQRVMRLEILGLGEEGLVGGDERQF